MKRLDEAQSAQDQSRSARNPSARNPVDGANIHRGIVLISLESDSRYLNGDMQGFTDVPVHARSNRRAKEVELPSEMGGRWWLQWELV